LSHECFESCQSDGVDVFAIITETHADLTKTDGVFPLTDAIERFKFRLFDILHVSKLRDFWKVLDLGYKPPWRGFRHCLVVRMAC
jgi:hypothetical protein